MLARMDAKAITPILNVSDIGASFAWFEKWGWKKLWDWGTPATFGADLDAAVNAQQPTPLPKGTDTP